LMVMVPLPSSKSRTSTLPPPVRALSSLRVAIRFSAGWTPVALPAGLVLLMVGAVVIHDLHVAFSLLW
jgi:hypothetical protein